MSYLDLRRLAVAGLVLLSAILLLGAGSAGAAGTLVAYNMYPLVSDGTTVSAPLTDPALVNGWGLSASATSPWWAANQKTNTSTLYTGAGSKNATVVTVAGGPTGTVANSSTTDFAVSQNGVSGAARFLFDTLGGQILGWTPTVNATNARRRGRQLRRRGRLHGPRDRERPALRGRLPQRPRRLVRRLVQAARAPVQGSEYPEGLGAVRHPGARREHLRHLRQAGPGEEERRSRAAGSATSTSSAPTGRC